MGDPGTDEAVLAGELDKELKASELRIVLIGVVGALAGSLIGGLVTWAVTREQISSQTKIEQTSEKRTAYSDFYGDAITLYDYLVSFRPTASQAHADAGAQSEKALFQAEDSALGVVELVAPLTIATSAYNADYELHALWKADLTYRGVGHEVTTAIGNVYADENLFIKAARADLGS